MSHPVSTFYSALFNMFHWIISQERKEKGLRELNIWIACIKFPYVIIGILVKRSEKLEKPHKHMQIPFNIIY